MRLGSAARARVGPRRFRHGDLLQDHFTVCRSSCRERVYASCHLRRSLSRDRAPDVRRKGQHGSKRDPSANGNILQGTASTCDESRSHWLHDTLHIALPGETAPLTCGSITERASSGDRGSAGLWRAGFTGTVYQTSQLIVAWDIEPRRSTSGYVGTRMSIHARVRQRFDAILPAATISTRWRISSRIPRTRAAGCPWDPPAANHRAGIRNEAAHPAASHGPELKRRPSPPSPPPPPRGPPLPRGSPSPFPPFRGPAPAPPPARRAGGGRGPGGPRSRRAPGPRAGGGGRGGGGAGPRPFARYGDRYPSTRRPPSSPTRNSTMAMTNSTWTNAPMV